ncbi:hypothetical protein C4544_04510 [candidate division WS5 bacterium]|uniref:Uncharacterized protein n=1 Tax=candidate division WS5 bacterium TaxID=2093353 RepID=A0A419DCK9_9BACT|nr:MAG: hypothetical protein C4544_04510 [candidate division WS5 bacterium]
MAVESPNSSVIVQRFLIDVEALDDMSETPLFQKDVVEPLKSFGYRIMASTEVTCGVPHSFQVEGPMSVGNINMKERVYTLLRCCGIVALSGEALIEL